MFTQTDILFGFVAPFAFAAALMLIAGRRWTWPASVGVAAAIVIAFSLRIEWPSLKPTDSLGWIWLIAVASSITGAMASLRKIPFWIFAIAAAVVAVGSTWLLLRPLVPHTWSMSNGVIWIGAVGVSTAIIALVNEAPARRGRRFSVLLCLFLIAAVSAVSLAISGSLKLGLLGGALTAGMAGITFVGIRRRPEGFHGLLFAFQVMLASLVMYGHFYSSLGSAPAALLFVSPLCIFVPELTRQTGIRADAMRLIAVLVPLTIAGSLAYREHAQKMDDPTGYYYSHDSGIGRVRAT